MEFSGHVWTTFMKLLWCFASIWDLEGLCPYSLRLLRKEWPGHSSFLFQRRKKKQVWNNIKVNKLFNWISKMVWTRQNYYKEESQEQRNKERMHCRSMWSSSGWIQAQNLKKKKNMHMRDATSFHFLSKELRKKEGKRMKEELRDRVWGPTCGSHYLDQGSKTQHFVWKKKTKEKKKSSPSPPPSVCTGGAGVSGNGLDYIANNGTEMWERKRGTRDESVRGNTLKRVKMKNRRGREKPYEATISDWVWRSDCGGILGGKYFLQISEII